MTCDDKPFKETITLTERITVPEPIVVVDHSVCDIEKEFVETISLGETDDVVLLLDDDTPLLLQNNQQLELEL